MDFRNKYIYSWHTKLKIPKTRKIKDIKSSIIFYTTFNQIVFEMLEDRNFCTEIINGDNPKLKKALFLIMGYAKAVHRQLHLENTYTINLSSISKNQKHRLALLNIEKKASILLLKLKNIEQYSKEEIYDIAQKANADKEALERSFEILFKERNTNISNTKKYPYLVPKIEPFAWSKVELKLKDRMEDIQIYYDSKLISTKSYKDLGFSANKKDHKPNRQWKLLTVLSVHQDTDFTNATPKNLLNSFATQAKKFTLDNLHQTKKLLSKSLQTIFQTDSEPFIKNREYYKPNFKILPSPDLRKGFEKYKEGGRYDDNVEHEE